MSKIEAKLPPYEYLSGRDFTDKLREVTKCDKYTQLASYFGVPRSTILTWHNHNRTAFELIVREHIATGASVRYMALGEGKPFEEENKSVNAIPTYRISSGLLEEQDKTSLDDGTLALYGLETKKTQIIIQDDQRCFVNTADTHATSGRYLIDIDGSCSINQIQKLPGKKLALSFGESTIDVAEDDIKVLGRVAMSMRKE